ncbi:MAG: SPOR domain-containing protein [Rhodothermales bacterium]|nr:SPOR domain-containing protein [Rhodothermales bacterium]
MRYLSLGLVLVLAACGGSRQVVMPEDVNPDPNLPVVHADYETFDASAYEDQAMAVPEEWKHDVPAELMENRADAGVEAEIAGYRVQVLATLDPAEAQRTEANLRNWWASRSQMLSPDSNLPAEMKVYRMFRQPYYRIRIGDLASREDAEELLAMVSRSFDGAFVVPDRVTIRR